MKDLRRVAIAQVLGLLCGPLLHSSNPLREPELYVFVHHVVEDPGRFVFAKLMIHGFVVAGSITEQSDDQTGARTFMLEYGKQEIRVNHTGPRPATFRDFATLEARGTLVERDGEYQLDAVELFSSPNYGCFKNSRGGGGFPMEMWLFLSEDRHSASR